MGGKHSKHRGKQASGELDDPSNPNGSAPLPHIPARDKRHKLPNPITYTRPMQPRAGATVDAHGYDDHVYNCEAGNLYSGRGSNEMNGSKKDSSTFDDMNALEDDEDDLPLSTNDILRIDMSHDIDDPPSVQEGAKGTDTNPAQDRGSLDDKDLNVNANNKTRSEIFSANSENSNDQCLNVYLNAQNSDEQDNPKSDVDIEKMKETLLPTILESGKKGTKSGKPASPQIESQAIDHEKSPNHERTASYSVMSFTSNHEGGWPTTPSATRMESDESSLPEEAPPKLKLRQRDIPGSDNKPDVEDSPKNRAWRIVRNNSGKKYYYNKLTKKSQWTPPTGIPQHWIKSLITSETLLKAVSESRKAIEAQTNSSAKSVDQSQNVAEETEDIEQPHALVTKNAQDGWQDPERSVRPPSPEMKSNTASNYESSEEAQLKLVLAPALAPLASRGTAQQGVRALTMAPVTVKASKAGRLGNHYPTAPARLIAAQKGDNTEASTSSIKPRPVLTMTYESPLIALSRKILKDAFPEDNKESDEFASNSPMTATQILKLTNRAPMPSIVASKSHDHINVALNETETDVTKLAPDNKSQSKKRMEEVKEVDSDAQPVACANQTGEQSDMTIGDKKAPVEQKNLPEQKRPAVPPKPTLSSNDALVIRQELRENSVVIPQPQPVVILEQKIESQGVIKDIDVKTPINTTGDSSSTIPSSDKQANDYESTKKIDDRMSEVEALVDTPVLLPDVPKTKTDRLLSPNLSQTPNEASESKSTSQPPKIPAKAPKVPARIPKKNTSIPEEPASDVKSLLDEKTENSGVAQSIVDSNAASLLTTPSAISNIVVLEDYPQPLTPPAPSPMLPVRQPIVRNIPVAQAKQLLFEEALHVRLAYALGIRIPIYPLSAEFSTSDNMQNFKDVVESERPEYASHILRMKVNDMADSEYIDPKVVSCARFRLSQLRKSIDVTAIKPKAAIPAWFRLMNLVFPKPPVPGSSTLNTSSVTSHVSSAASDTTSGQTDITYDTHEPNLRQNRAISFEAETPSDAKPNILPDIDTRQMLCSAWCPGSKVFITAKIMYRWPLGTTSVSVFRDASALGDLKLCLPNSATITDLKAKVQELSFDTLLSSYQVVFMRRTRIPKLLDSIEWNSYSQINPRLSPLKIDRSRMDYRLSREQTHCDENFVELSSQDNLSFAALGLSGPLTVVIQAYPIHHPHQLYPVFVKLYPQQGSQVSAKPQQTNVSVQGANKSAQQSPQQQPNMQTLTASQLPLDPEDTIGLYITLSDTVLDLKRQIQGITSLLPSQQVLNLGYVALEDARSLITCGVEPNDVLMLGSRYFNSTNVLSPRTACTKAISHGSALFMQSLAWWKSIAKEDSFVNSLASIDATSNPTRAFLAFLRANYPTTSTPKSMNGVVISHTDKDEVQSSKEFVDHNSMQGGLAQDLVNLSNRLDAAISESNRSTFIWVIDNSSRIQGMRGYISSFRKKEYFKEGVAVDEDDPPIFCNPNDNPGDRISPLCLDTLAHPGNDTLSSAVASESISGGDAPSKASIHASDDALDIQNERQTPPFNPLLSRRLSPRPSLMDSDGVALGARRVSLPDLPSLSSRCVFPSSPLVQLPAIDANSVTSLSLVLMDCARGELVPAEVSRVPFLDLPPVLRATLLPWHDPFAIDGSNLKRLPQSAFAFDSAITAMNELGIDESQDSKTSTTKQTVPQNNRPRPKVPHVIVDQGIEWPDSKTSDRTNNPTTARPIHLNAPAPVPAWPSPASIGENDDSSNNNLVPKEASELTIDTKQEEVVTCALCNNKLIETTFQNEQIKKRIWKGHKPICSEFRKEQPQPGNGVGYRDPSSLIAFIMTPSKQLDSGSTYSLCFNFSGLTQTADEHRWAAMVRYLTGIRACAAVVARARERASEHLHSKATTSVNLNAGNDMEKASFADAEDRPEAMSAQAILPKLDTGADNIQSGDDRRQSSSDPPARRASDPTVEVTLSKSLSESCEGDGMRTSIDSSSLGGTNEAKASQKRVTNREYPSNSTPCAPLTAIDAGCLATLCEGVKLEVDKAQAEIEILEEFTNDEEKLLYLETRDHCLGSKEKEENCFLIASFPDEFWLLVRSFESESNENDVLPPMRILTQQGASVGLSKGTSLGMAASFGPALSDSIVMRFHVL